METNDWLGLGALVCGGGGLVGGASALGKAWIDKASKAAERHWNTQAEQFNSSREENITLRERVETQAGVITRLTAEAILSEGTIKRLRRQRNALVRHIRSLGLDFDFGLMEISESGLEELSEDAEDLV